MLRCPRCRDLAALGALVCPGCRLAVGYHLPTTRPPLDACRGGRTVNGQKPLGSRNRRRAKLPMRDRRCRECDASAGAQRHPVLDNSVTPPEYAWSRTRERPIPSRLVRNPVGNVSCVTDANVATIRCCLAPRHSTPHGRYRGHASADAWPMDSAAASAPIPPSRSSPHSQSIRAPLQSAGFRTSPELSMPVVALSSFRCELHSGGSSWIRMGVTITRRGRLPARRLRVTR